MLVGMLGIQLGDRIHVTSVTAFPLALNASREPATKTRE
jgi:hypothetical protein